MNEPIILKELSNIIKDIEELVWLEDITYIEAAIQIAEKHEIEEENIGNIIKNCPALYQKITEEAERLHFIEKTNRLPFNQ